MGVLLHSGKRAFKKKMWASERIRRNARAEGLKTVGPSRLRNRSVEVDQPLRPEKKEGGKGKIVGGCHQKKGNRTNRSVDKVKLKNGHSFKKNRKGREKKDAQGKRVGKREKALMVRGYLYRTIWELLNKELVRGITTVGWKTGGGGFKASSRPVETWLGRKGGGSHAT